MIEKQTAFGTFLRESFGEGRRVRELRLSREELGYLAQRYPRAVAELRPEGATEGGKNWYEVALPPLVH